MPIRVTPSPIIYSVTWCPKMVPKVLPLFLSTVLSAETIESLLRVTEVRAAQPPKAPPPMLITLLGISIEVRPVHPEKALLAIYFTLLRCTEERPVHPEKALLPTSFTLLRVSEVRPEQFRKALLEIALTLLGITKSVISVFSSL